MRTMYKSGHEYRLFNDLLIMQYILNLVFLALLYYSVVDFYTLHLTISQRDTFVKQFYIYKKKDKREKKAYQTISKVFISRYGIRFTCSSLMRIFYRYTCGTNRFRATSKWLRNACTNVQIDQKESYSGSKTGDRAMPQANEKEKLQRGKKNQLFLTWCSLERIKLFRSLICNDTVSKTVRCSVVSFYKQRCFVLRL